MSDDIVEKIILKGKAAEEIRRLRAENEHLANRELKLLRDLEKLAIERQALRNALKPFANAVEDNFNWKYEINPDDFRAAVAALKESGND